MYEPQFKTRKNGVPILTDAEIDFHAEKFIGDYKPAILRKPQPLDMDDFAEFYLGLSPDYARLSRCGLLQGRTVFCDTDKIPVYVPEEGRAEYIPAKKGTIIIDNTLLDEVNEYRYRLTMGHECGHWIYHSGCFTNCLNWQGRCEMKDPVATECRHADVERVDSENETLVTEKDWMEYQARYFSSALLMPKDPFVRLASDPDLHADIRNCGNGFNEDELLADSIAKVFQVPPSSAKMRMKQLGVSMSGEIHAGGRNNNHIFDSISHRTM